MLDTKSPLATSNLLTFGGLRNISFQWLRTWKSQMRYSEAVNYSQMFYSTTKISAMKHSKIKKRLTINNRVATQYMNVLYREIRQTFTQKQDKSKILGIFSFKSKIKVRKNGTFQSFSRKKGLNSINFSKK